MSINQIQFQRGLSMAGFMERYGTEGKCHAALVASRWPDGFRCPECGDERHSRFVREGRTYWQCHRCRHQTTVTAGTVFEATKLPLTRWFIAMHLMTQAKNNVSALELKRHLGVRYKSAWLMKHKLLQVMTEREDRRVLDGRVEIDDAYLGGERAGKPGRGSENKVSFVGEVASHTRIVVGSGRQAVEHPEFRRVNTVLSNLKTAISGTYHAFKFAKYADRYLAEVQYRFNRRFDLSSILVRLVRAAALTRPRPESMIRLAEVGG